MSKRPITVGLTVAVEEVQTAVHRLLPKPMVRPATEVAVSQQPVHLSRQGLVEGGSVQPLIAHLGEAPVSQRCVERLSSTLPYDDSVKTFRNKHHAYLFLAGRIQGLQVALFSALLLFTSFSSTFSSSPLLVSVSHSLLLSAPL